MICLKLTPRLFSLCEITSYFCYFHILTLPPENVHHMKIGTPCQQTSLTGEYPNITTTFARLDILMTMEFLIITPRKTRPLCLLRAARQRGYCVSRTDMVPAEAAILVREMERQIIKTSNERECFSL